MQVNNTFFFLFVIHFAHHQKIMLFKALFSCVQCDIELPVFKRGFHLKKKNMHSRDEILVYIFAMLYMQLQLFTSVFKQTIMI